MNPNPETVTNGQIQGVELTAAATLYAALAVALKPVLTLQNIPTENRSEAHLDVGSSPAVPTHLVGITSGGAILAAALRADLGLAAPHGIINASLHRDDFSARGLAAAAAKAPTHLPFDVNGAHVVLVDDVLYTGRTLRAVINELFDYGRPARISLCVLLDRGAEARDLPFAPTFAAHSCTLPHDVSVDLSGSAATDFAWQFFARNR